MGMRDMYAYAIQTAKGKFHGNAEERDGKPINQGSPQELKRIWQSDQAEKADRGEVDACHRHPCLERATR